jgi:signal transduction histidine kinase
MHKRVKELNGMITIKSELNLGTTIDITIPTRFRG